MNKKFVFINLSINSGYTSGENHGIAHLIPIVRKHSYEPAFLNIRSEITCKEFRNKIDKINPSIVGFSCTSHQFKYLVKYSKELAGRSGILQIAGGPGPTLDPEGLLSKSAVKGVCIGEGEVPIDNLLNNIEGGRDIFNTESFCWRTDGGIKKNSVQQFVHDLSTLDFPDYSLFSRDVVINNGSLLITLSRGCPYDCYYCSNAALRSLYPSPKGYFRIPSVEHSIELLEGMIKQYPETKFIIFEDDLLIANKAWFEGFATEYRKRINLPYSADVRAEYITPDIIKALKNSGCERVLLGLESGNEDIRNNVLNRKHSNNLIIEKSKMIKDAGFPLFTFNIVGLPFESGKQMEDTFNLNLEIKPNHGVCTFFYPYKGTVL
ncbi:MAG: radical SAM protein, partial [Candidatus Omnitrophota bacterium]